MREIPLEELNEETKEILENIGHPAWITISGGTLYVTNRKLYCFRGNATKSAEYNRKWKSAARQLVKYGLARRDKSFGIISVYIIPRNMYPIMMTLQAEIRREKREETNR